MRISQQRQLILELLWRSPEHLSAREIYNRLNQQGKQICQTSVYQNLAALSQHGIIECLERSEGNLYGSFTDSHSHVNCLDSEQIFNVWVQLPNSLVEKVEQQTNTKIVDYRIEFYGLCGKSS
ncbi:transcriptional repressor [Pleurocapsales cyanobacterium LEGE 06147]|nr:transcriptional repressor [Pleurocapsales cyanobacterium LEGE 06147]